MLSQEKNDIHNIYNIGIHFLSKGNIHAIQYKKT